MDYFIVLRSSLLRPPRYTQHLTNRRGRTNPLISPRGKRVVCAKISVPGCAFTKKIPFPGKKQGRRYRSRTPCRKIKGRLTTATANIAMKSMAGSSSSSRAMPAFLINLHTPRSASMHLHIRRGCIRGSESCMPATKREAIRPAHEQARQHPKRPYVASSFVQTNRRSHSGDLLAKPLDVRTTKATHASQLHLSSVSASTSDPGRSIDTLEERA